MVIEGHNGKIKFTTGVLKKGWSAGRSSKLVEF